MEHDEGLSLKHGGFDYTCMKNILVNSDGIMSSYIFDHSSHLSD